MSALDYDALRKPVEPGDEYVLSTGEALSLCSEPELKRLERKVAKRMLLWNKQSGRCLMDDDTKAAPYDELLLKRERERRLKLTTISFCGLTFFFESMRTVYGEERYSGKYRIPRHLQKRAVFFAEETREVGGHRGEDGSWVKDYETTPAHWRVRTRVYTLARDAEWSLYGHFPGSSMSKQKIVVTEDELREYRGRGAILTELPDPNAPWKVMEEPA